MLRMGYEQDAMRSRLFLSAAPFAAACAVSGAVVCSQLFADSYAWVTERLLVKDLATPAALSAAERLRDIDLSWQQLPSVPKKPTDPPPPPAPTDQG